MHVDLPEHLEMALSALEADLDHPNSCDVCFSWNPETAPDAVHATVWPDLRDWDSGLACEKDRGYICKDASPCDACKAREAEAWAATQPEHIVEVAFSLMSEDHALPLADAAAIAYGCTVLA